ncbi:hypothetical protein BJV82DRAFT_596454 [Fennellomyces sp. T-0311]|nr:hypothetical protein BJV82DRAFT_596454 [Fennellomyces sp. T-0311]
MHRTRPRSVSQVQDEEIASIEAHHEYINRVLKWSISDLDRFINLLKGRAYAEEAYVQQLMKVSKAHATAEVDNFNCFGSAETTFRRATLHYERSIEQTIKSRKILIHSMWAEISKFQQLKDNQETRRKKVKSKLAEANQNYISYRTREVPKLHRAYTNRCNELDNAQQQLQTQQQQQLLQNQQGSLSPMSNHGSDLDLRDGEPTRLSSEEPRPRLSADNDSISSLNNDTTLRKGMQNFMAQMRTQIANATAAAAVQDMTKQGAKVARITNEIITADQEYRVGIRTLERLRKTQIHIATAALKHLETIFADKINLTKTSLTEVLNQERAMLAEEARIAEITARSVDDVDSQKDIYLFSAEYQKKRYIAPSRIYYEHAVYGKSKDLLFGMSLDEYYMEYNRTVPMIVSKCIESVERMGGLQKEGIYRISGRQSNVEALKYKFEKDEQEIVLEGSKFDVVTIASVLKIYLRELQTPLFSLSVQTRMEYATLEKQRRLVALQNKLASLPKIHRDTLHALIRHLANVNNHSQVNKMNIQNLSLIFTPAIFHDHNQAEMPGEWRTDCVFEDMLLYHEPLFTYAEAQSQNAAQHSQQYHHQQSQQQLHAPHHPQGGLVSAQSSTATLVNSSQQMLLTQPLHPGNLTSPQQEMYRGPPPPHPPRMPVDAQKQPRSASLNTAAPATGTPSTRPMDRRPSQPAIIASPESQYSAEANEDAATWIGMAAMSGALEHKSEAAMGGGLRGITVDTRPTVITTAPTVDNYSPVTSPADDQPSSSRPSSVVGAKAGKSVPPRQDSLRVTRQQIAAQQQQQPAPPLPPPIITTTPIAKPAPQRTAPTTGPQTPTIAMGGSAHIPSSAVIIENPAGSQESLSDSDSSRLARSLNFG